MKLQNDVFIGTILSVLAIIVLTWVIPAQIPNTLDETAMPPALMANLSMSIVLFLSILLIISGVRRQQDPAESLLTRKNLRWLTFVGVSLGISGLLIHYLGFFFGGIIIVSGYMIKMGEKRPSTVLCIAGGAAGICYLALRLVQ